MIDPEEFVKHSAAVINTAREAFAQGAIDLAAFEERVELALVVEDPMASVPAGWGVEDAFVREIRKLLDPAYVHH